MKLKILLNYVQNKKELSWLKKINIVRKKKRLVKSCLYVFILP